MIINQHKIKCSHEDKIIFPAVSITKKDLINYYLKISDVMLPHIKNRPITMHRFPDGIDNEGFYMKNAPDYFPDWIDTISIDKKEGGQINHVICNSKATLAYMANQACITPHIWLSTKGEINKPDKMIFDLDPSNDDYKKVKKAALNLKEVLEEKGLVPFVMTTGSKGCHVVVPIKAEFDFDEVRTLALNIAKEVVQNSPDDFTVEQRKEKRDDKVFLDILRNAYGQTSVAPYSLRSIKSAPVATPLSWDEFKKHPLEPQRYTINNIFHRLGQIEDPWKDFNKHCRTIEDFLGSK